MKKLLSILILSVLLATILATPALAKGPVGERISLWNDATMEFAADAPFYIEHGWALEKQDLPRGVFDFILYVDGVPVAPAYSLTFLERDPWALYRFQGFNFPEGMTGEHTFEGSWIAPCRWAVKYGDYEGECALPNEPVESKHSTVTITFVVD
jgi:hypothetical protein